MTKRGTIICGFSSEGKAFRRIVVDEIQHNTAIFFPLSIKSICGGTSFEVHC